MSENKIAVLIDAENIDPTSAQQIFSRAETYGVVAIREIYGSGIALNEWMEPVLQYTINTNLTLRPNRYKNSSDITMVIGAMQILVDNAQREEEDRVKKVLIASSDSDFAPLAVHLRKAGLIVIGMGEAGRINPLWPMACTEFVEMESTASDTSAPSEESAPPEPETTPATPSSKEPDDKTGQKPVAPTHRARVEIIRAHIEEQITAHNGRVRSSDLFRALNPLPDYQLDQRRSRRNPQDYLRTQFGTWFTFEPGEKGSFWVGMKTPAHSTDTEVDATAEASKASVETVEAETIDAPKTDEVERPATLEEQLTKAGIPFMHVTQVVETLADCHDLRDVFNKMRSAFGATSGRNYHEIIKSFVKAGQIEFEPKESTSSDDAADDRPYTREEILKMEYVNKPEPSAPDLPYTRAIEQVKSDSPLTDLTIMGMTDSVIRELNEKGIETVGAFASLSEEELSSLNHVGKVRLRRLLRMQARLSKRLEQPAVEE